MSNTQNTIVYSCPCGICGADTSKIKFSESFVGTKWLYCSVCHNKSKENTSLQEAIASWAFEQQLHSHYAGVKNNLNQLLLSGRKSNAHANAS